MRIGIGMDVHPLSEDKPLIIGGVIIPSSIGSQGHSDGDALIHAIIDALLGAVGLGDIGSYFPSNDDKWANVRSTYFLKDSSLASETEEQQFNDQDAQEINEELSSRLDNFEIKQNKKN